MRRAVWRGGLPLTPSRFSGRRVAVGQADPELDFVTPSANRRRHPLVVLRWPQLVRQDVFDLVPPRVDPYGGTDAAGGHPKRTSRCVARTTDRRLPRHRLIADYPKSNRAGCAMLHLATRGLQRRVVREQCAGRSPGACAAGGPLRRPRQIRRGRTVGEGGGAVVCQHCGALQPDRRFTRPKPMLR